MDLRVQIDARGHDAGADVGATLHVHAAIDSKRGRPATGGEVEMGDALGRIRIADDRIEEPHVEIACGFGLPARVVEIVQNSR